MPGNIAGWFSDGVSDPAPLAPSYLNVNSLPFSCCPQFFIPYDVGPLKSHDGRQASVDEELRFVGGRFSYSPCF